MTDLKQLALEAARAIGDDISDCSHGAPLRLECPRCLAVAMLRFAAKVKCEACIHQAADELEGKL